MYFRVLEITTNVGCKNNCKYCPQPVNVKAYVKRGGPKMMSLAVFKQCIDKLPAEISIFFAGSAEPWLNPECTEMVRYAYDKGFNIRIYTSLVGVRKEDLVELSKMKFEKVTIHLPSSSGRENFFANEDYLSLVEVSQSLNIANLEYMSVGAVDPKVKGIIRMPIREMRFANMSDFAGNLKNDNAFHLKRMQGKIWCTSRNLFWNVLYPNGDVTLCCEDFGMKHVLGNLLEMEYKKLFKGNELRKVRKGLLDDKMDVLCRYCEYAENITRFQTFKKIVRYFVFG